MAREKLMRGPDGVAWELRNIRKTFGPVVANDDVSLALHRGQIHGLVGENGSGKSTLIKTLCGVHRPDAGAVLCDGRPVQLDHPLTARALGVATVFQEFSLVPNLTVAENIQLGRWPGGSFRVDWRALRAAVRRVLDELDIDIPADARVGDLSKAQQQLVEIAKGIATNATLFILDEPTTALGAREIEHLHQLLRRMRASGTAVLYISHRLDEVVQLADVVTVMRNGRVVSAADETPLDRAAIITRMIGKEIEQHYARTRTGGGTPLLEAVNVSSDHGVRDVTFTLHRGEVLGLGGMLGAGRSEIARALFAVDRLIGGEIRLLGRTLTMRSPADAIAAGIALLTEDRKSEGLFFNFTGAENITVANLSEYDRGLWLDLRRERAASDALVEQLRLPEQARFQTVDRLSGGNQQKILIARWLITGAQVLIFDEPTQGIDVGAKEAVYQLINDITRAGKGVILISSDDQELLSISDRVAIVRHGRIARVARSGELTKSDLLETTAEQMAAA
jgi:ribose transport system ATP-binding protein